VSVEEKGIIIQQSQWEPVKEQIKYYNQNLVCSDGNEKTKDYENMRSYCYYQGNCLNLGLQSLFVTLPQGEELEIVKAQYLLQQTDPFRCEIMI